MRRAIPTPTVRRGLCRRPEARHGCNWRAFLYPPRFRPQRRASACRAELAALLPAARCRPRRGRAAPHLPAMAQDTLHGVTPSPAPREPAEPGAASPDRVAAVMARLAAADPDPKAGLGGGDPYQLLVTVLMSRAIDRADGGPGGARALRRGADARGRRGAGARARGRDHQAGGARRQQVAPHHRPVGDAARRVRRRDAPRLGGDAALPRHRPQDRRGDGQLRLRRAGDRRRHARVPRVEPHPAGARQDARRRGGRARRRRAGPLQGRRPRVAVPPRPRHLHGAPPGLRALHRGGPVHVARQRLGRRAGRRKRDAGAACARRASSS